MTVVLLIIAFALLLGPLRPWSARHWALLTSLLVGAFLGWTIGSAIAAFCRHLWYMPALGTLLGAWELAAIGPGILRRIDKDGKE